MSTYLSLNIRQGETKVLDVDATVAGGGVFPLDGYQVVFTVFRDPQNPVVTKDNYLLGGLTFRDAPMGRIRVRLASGDTAKLAGGYSIQIAAKAADGTVVSIVHGKLHSVAGFSSAGLSGEDGGSLAIGTSAGTVSIIGGSNSIKGTQKFDFDGVTLPIQYGDHSIVKWTGHDFLETAGSALGVTGTANDSIEAAPGSFARTVIDDAKVMVEFDVSDLTDDSKVTLTPGTPLDTINTLKGLDANARDATIISGHTEPLVFFSTVNGFQGMRGKSNQQGFETARFPVNSSPLTIYWVGWFGGTGYVNITRSYDAGNALQLLATVNTEDNEVLMRGDGFSSSYILNRSLAIDQLSVWEFHIDGSNSFVKVNGEPLTPNNGFDPGIARVDQISVNGSQFSELYGGKEAVQMYWLFATDLTSGEQDALRTGLMTRFKTREGYGVASPNSATYNTANLVVGLDFSDPAARTWNSVSGITSIAGYGSQPIVFSKVGGGSVDLQYMPRSYVEGRQLARVTGDARLVGGAFASPLADYTIVMIGADQMAWEQVLFCDNAESNILTIDNRATNFSTTGLLNETITYSRGTVDSDTGHIHAGHFSVWSLDSNGTLRINGRIRHQFAPGSNPLTNLVLGNNTAGSKPWKGVLGHVLVYDKVLNTTELETIGQALASDFDLQKCHGLYDDPTETGVVYYDWVIDHHRDTLIPLADLPTVARTHQFVLTATTTDVVGYDLLFTDVGALLDHVETISKPDVIEVIVDGDGGTLGGHTESGSGKILKTSMRMVPKSGGARPFFDLAGSGLAKGLFIVGGAGDVADQVGNLYIEGMDFANSNDGYSGGQYAAPIVQLQRGDVHVHDCNVDSCLNFVHSTPTNVTGIAKMTNCSATQGGAANGKAHGLNYLHCEQAEILDCDVTETCVGHHTKYGRNPNVRVRMENIRALDLKGGYQYWPLTTQIEGGHSQRWFDINRSAHLILKNIMVQVGDFSVVLNSDTPLGGFASVSRPNYVDANSRPKMQGLFYFQNITVASHGVEALPNNPGGDYDFTGTHRVVDALQVEFMTLDSDDLLPYLIRDSVVGNPLSNPHAAATGIITWGGIDPGVVNSINNDTTSSFTDAPNGDFSVATGLGATTVQDCSAYFPYV